MSENTVLVSVSGMLALAVVAIFMTIASCDRNDSNNRFFLECIKIHKPVDCKAGNP